MVQRKAARFVTNTYSREPGTLTNILQSLGWPTLETRRKGARLISSCIRSYMEKLQSTSPSTSDDRQHKPDSTTKIGSPASAHQRMPTSTVSFQGQSRTGTISQRRPSKHPQLKPSGRGCGSSWCEGEGGHVLSCF